MRKNGMELPLYKTQIKVIEESCIDAGIETTYWLSIDKENGVVRYGKYWTHKNLTCFEATYKGPNEKGALVWIDEKYKWLAQLRHVDIIQDGDSDTPPTLAILPVAVVMDESPFIVSSDSVTLAQLETGAVTVPANLPEACQRLYGNVTGKEIILNDKEFPNFTDAIEMSCRREDGWCHKRLKTKAGKGDPDATYLRITLGFNYGDSPGVPYVLEIWPPKHYSSVHDHGDACAIIKVLHGEINATYYDTLQKRRPAVIGSPALFQEGQITWLSPTRFQIHKLHNTSDRVCCTIQCYRYEKQDNKHYEAFRFQDGSGEVKDFTPNSDMSYIAFRQQMMKEWNDMMFGGGGK
ncbi:RmlC-like cupin domain-containing protein [Microdochium bolleyi]|uniref:Cysteine dioxygenase n=1 Tax=Microdochium bolleyi TaxID=196109 RepID=A0A136IMG4_9PEZI|nr:RmlC-like cupin domain-containing protein [Microdochium bolleyi]